jgi:hypothetical protein
MTDILNKVIKFLDNEGIWYSFKSTHILSDCPLCGRRDKFSIRKRDGKTICYRGSCDYRVKSFIEFVAMIKKISKTEAEDLLFEVKRSADNKLKFNFIRPEEVDRRDTINLFDQTKEIQWPPDDTYSIDALGSVDGRGYLQSRAVSLETAMKYKIRYRIWDRRVIIPIFIENKCYGYQGRAIDKIEDSRKMRNNDGLEREKIVMFYNNLKSSDFAIICEGPFDSLAFDDIGGNIATLGKVITESQLDLIKLSGVKACYLALDEDASAETRKVSAKLGIPTYLIRVPQSAKTRCLSLNKKADFAECSKDEIRQAFEGAELFDKSKILLYFKPQA